MRFGRAGASKFVLGSLIFALGGCGAAGGRPQTGSRGSAAMKPLGGDRVGSPVVITRSAGRTLAFVADADERAIYTLDVDAGRELATTELGAAPGQLLLTSGGQLFVSFRDASRIAALELRDPSEPLETLRETKVPIEPVALSAPRDEKTLLVTSGWGRALSAFDTDDLRPLWQVRLEREPRASLVDDQGDKVFVSHAIGGRISIVSLSDPHARARSIRILSQPEPIEETRTFRGTALKHRIRVGLQNFTLAKSVSPPGRVFSPGVLVDPGDPEQQSNGYGDVFLPHVASVAVIDAETERLLPASVDAGVPVTTSLGWGERAPQCLLPRSAVVDPKSGMLLVACVGLGQVMAFDAGSAAPSSTVLASWPVADDPLGIALDPERQRALVWSQQERSVDVIDLSLPDASGRRIELSRRARQETADLGLGRALFHKVNDSRISNDGRACASCHPDGRDDGLTWSTPGGPRQTPQLAGRVTATEPYGWNGLGTDLLTHLSHTFQRLRGAGLADREQRALIAYVESLGLPAHVAPNNTPGERAKGARVFALAGCSECHNGRALTDGQLHDVHSRAQADADGRFNTPSLIGIASSAPYFHDGRYPSLEQMLASTDGRMGSTRQLSPDNKQALIAYLESL